MAVVEFKDVDIIFGSNPAPALALLDGGADREKILEETGNVLGVAGASLAVNAGEICVLMGLSGSGKSTLLRAVNGLNKVSRGKVLIEHEGQQLNLPDTDASTLRHLRMHRISMVFQQFALLPWRTVAENVGFGLELRGVGRRERLRIVEEKLSLVQLDQWKDKFVHELSGGMQQRVGLARAFATDADILLMDEPFSALDPLIRSRLQDELLQLQEKMHKTIIFVSHDLDEALKIGNKIAIMDQARIVQYDTAEEIVRNPANAYVSDFVGHMNPLNVLKGRSLMAPLAKIPKEEGELVLDRTGCWRIRVDKDGKLLSATTNGKPSGITGFEPGNGFDGIGYDQYVTAPPDIMLRDVIEIRRKSGSPVLLVENGTLIGMIGDDEIFEGFLN
ncbi:choline ABC transporter ATP-binding protein [Sneathiella chungangensis]|uniref:Trimethylamine N-oxide transport system ATP-binding protein TmoW n=1 Tax=Sneathiella chungangensis TaxID=1418234 RepID=A0A845MEZ6_9PROT|nr:choline ABC transporter ATP-binding protein [Sneathiella chungangensis]MZR21876.1 choline ABC transporter ATP-binding protein [Sneathiella chungangensis]